MSFVKLRVLITDYDQSATNCSTINHTDDGEILNVAVGNIVSHSRVKVYVLLRDFKNVAVVLQKFPAIIPVMVDALSDIDNTRKILRLLPRMNHIVNLLGNHIARELAGKDDFFRIKAVSSDYIKDSKKVIEKILESDAKQGIIFNVSSEEKSQFGETCKVEKVLMNLKNSFHENKNKNKTMQPGDEQEQGSKACSSKIVHQNENNAPTRSANNVSQVPSVFGYCFPQFKTKAIIPSNPQNYPTDLDDRMKAALQHLHKKAAGKWKTKSGKLVKKDSDASQKVERKVDKWKKEELPNAIAKIEKDNQRTLERSFDPELKEKIIKRRHDSANAEVEREGRKLMSQKRNTLEAKLSYSVATLEQEHYQYLIRKQLSLLNNVWQG